MVESLPGLDPGTAVTLLGCTFVYLVESLPGLDPLHLFAKPVGQPLRLVLPDWACASWCKLVKCWINQSYIIEITLSQLNAQNLAEDFCSLVLRTLVLVAFLVPVRVVERLRENVGFRGQLFYYFQRQAQGDAIRSARVFVRGA